MTTLNPHSKNEKGFSESGVEPMDSYVVDDGWNNYNNSNTTSTVHDVARCGTTDNVTGFWEFNNKFPNGFRPASEESLAPRIWCMGRTSEVVITITLQWVRFCRLWYVQCSNR